MKKKNLFGFLAFATIGVALVSCKNDAYKIFGTIENAKEGDSVALVKRGEDFKFDTLASSLIKDGKFSIEGKQDTVSVFSLLYTDKNTGEVKAYPVFIEPGNIQVEISKEKEVIKGTSSNDIFQPVRNDMKFVKDMKISLYEKLMSGSVANDTPEYDSLLTKYRSLDVEFVNKIYDVIKTNATNEVGGYLFSAYAENYDEAKKLEVYGLLSENNKKKPGIVSMIRRIENAKKTTSGNKYLDFEMKDMEGNAVKLSDYVGKHKLLLVDFWASWCGPCRAITPSLIKIYNDYKDKGLQVLGVSFDYKLEDWKKGVEDLGIPWPQMSDLKGWASIASDTYVIKGIPELILLDEEGTILKRGLGEEELIEILNERLK